MNSLTCGDVIQYQTELLPLMTYHNLLLLQQVFLCACQIDVISILSLGFIHLTCNQTELLVLPLMIYHFQVDTASNCTLCLMWHPFCLIQTPCDSNCFEYIFKIENYREGFFHIARQPCLSHSIVILAYCFCCMRLALVGQLPLIYDYSAEKQKTTSLTVLSDHM